MAIALVGLLSLARLAHKFGAGTPTMTTAKLNRVLLVEDEIDIQTVARLALEDLGGFEVEVCASGAEALAIGPGFGPQLILLDFMMPGMDGRSTMKAFGGQPQLAGVPVVFLTARAQLEEVAEYRELGAIDVIVKPFDAMQLPDEIKRIWRRYCGQIERKIHPGPS